MTGTSLLRRMRWSFLWLFVISIPMWWFFEYMNTVVQNWHYVFAHPISILHYEIQASIDFSTVVPAVLSTSTLVFQLLRRHSLNTRVAIPGTALLIAFLSTFVLFWLLNLFPSETFPLVWIVPILFLKPLAYTFGVRASLVHQIEQGNLTLPLSLGIGALVTGFWWECWNFYSLPKWIYTIPYVGFWKDLRDADPGISGLSVLWINRILLLSAHLELHRQAGSGQAVFFPILARLPSNSGRSGHSRSTGLKPVREHCPRLELKMTVPRSRVSIDPPGAAIFTCG